MSLLFSPSLRTTPAAMTMHSSSLSPPSARRGTSGHNNRTSLDDEVQRWKHLYVLPVLLLEFLALALTRAVLPALLLAHFGSRRVYLVMGAVDCVRGLLAFGASPIFGKLSDVVGRKLCLLVTVLGTCAPVCSLAFFSWEVAAGGDSVTSGSSSSGDYLETVGGQSANALEETSDASGFWPSLWDSAAGEATAGTPIVPPGAIPLFVVLLALSGMFSSTFTLVFAYISDTVPHQDERVSAYGLALATFGLSFTIGPMIGGYLAQSHPQYVFLTSLLLTIVDLLYVYFILPESRQLDHEGSFESSVSVMSKDATFSWNPIKSLRLVAVDPFLRKVGEVAFLYYTGLWALISTLSVYAVQRFHLGPERLGELMSALGLCTMVAEAVLVRIMVPLLGEKRSIQIGLVSFGLQCIVLGFAYEPWHLFVGAAFSLLGNLVYPSLSSLVSGSVEPDAVGEALGAMNGIKALTEGIGPLLFGSLMTLSEHSTLPGWPYLVAAVLVLAAYRSAQDLPDLEEDDYIHEVDKRRPRRRRPTGSRRTAGDIMMTHTARDDSEYGELLSEIESDEDDAADVPSTPPRQGVDL